jgi:hypothetical protein
MLHQRLPPANAVAAFNPGLSQRGSAVGKKIFKTQRRHCGLYFALDGA